MGKAYYGGTIFVKCKVVWCHDEAVTKGYCNKHYQQMRKHGEVKSETERSKIKVSDKCSISGCDNKVFAKGYCNKHYQQIRKHGSIIAQRKSKKRDDKYEIICNIEYCNEKQYAKGYCQKHYMRLYLYNDPYYIPENSIYRKKIEKKCLVRK